MDGWYELITWQSHDLQNPYIHLLHIYNSNVQHYKTEVITRNICDWSL